MTASSFGGYGLLTGDGPFTDKLSEMEKCFVGLFGLKHIPPQDLLEIKRLTQLCERSPEMTA
jgi:hypothetical protein